MSKVYIIGSTGKCRLNESYEFCVDASEAGEGQLEIAVNDGEIPNQVQVLDNAKCFVNFVPEESVPHVVDIKFNGQNVNGCPFVVEVVSELEEKEDKNQAKTKDVISEDIPIPVQKEAPSNEETIKHQTSIEQPKQQQQQQQQQLQQSTKAHPNSKSGNGKLQSISSTSSSQSSSKEEELLQNILVRGISSRRVPINYPASFIIETNRLAQSRDFDVLITNPKNSLVDVQCYLQQEDGNLLVEWTPRQVGTHKIEVLYKERQLPKSPFISETFDPYGIKIEDVKTVYYVNDRIEFKIDRKEAGYGELEVTITNSSGLNQPIDIKSLEEQQVGEIGELISFIPTVPDKYKMSLSFNGYDVPQSPITFIARDSGEIAKVSGFGLREADVNRIAQFLVESPSKGQLKLRIECGDREIVPKVEKRANTYTVSYKPTEIGYASISVYWNGVHVDGSPYSVPVNDLSKILFLSGTNKSSNSNNQRIMHYEPKVSKEITVDTSKCGPGELKAEAHCRANRNIKFSIPIQQYSNNRYKLTFCCPPKPELLAEGVSLDQVSVEATYLIEFYYNNLSVPPMFASVVVSPVFGASTQQHQQSQQAQQPLPPQQDQRLTMENNNNSPIQLVGSKNLPEQQQQLINNSAANVVGSVNDDVDCLVVALRGHGLVDAKCGEEAEFTIDGSKAGPGNPEVRFGGGQSAEELKVRLDQLDDKLYKATYVAQVAGTYSLNVLWDGKQVAGCPVSVNVTANCDASKVLCTGDGLKGGVLGEEIKTFIDTRRAGPGELTAICTGPQKVAFCELLDRGDGTFILYIKPQEPGRQFLTIKYGGQHIPKSPFLIKVSGKPDPSRVRVYGPGVEHGVLSLYQSRFVCDTRGAGAGQLTVRIRGPKGAFRMETQRESQRDRTILCKYDPTEPGDYRIEIKWSGRHVPGSPFSVMIFDTQEELNRFLIGGQTNNHHSHHLTAHQQAPFRL